MLQKYKSESSKEFVLGVGYSSIPSNIHDIQVELNKLDVDTDKITINIVELNATQLFNQIGGTITGVSINNLIFNIQT